MFWVNGMKWHCSNRYWPVYVLLWVCTAVTLTACFGGGGEQPTADQTVLTCSEMCAQQGQCGTGTDARLLVLGRSDRPETRDHDLVFNSDLPITIQQTREEMVQSALDGQTMMQPFSFVVLNENGQQGWVANWCLASAPTP